MRVHSPAASPPLAPTSATSPLLQSFPSEKLPFWCFWAFTVNSVTKARRWARPIDRWISRPLPGWGLGSGELSAAWGEQLGAQPAVALGSRRMERSPGPGGLGAAPPGWRASSRLHPRRNPDMFAGLAGGGQGVRPRGPLPAPGRVDQLAKGVAKGCDVGRAWGEGAPGLRGKFSSPACSAHTSACEG